MKNLIVFIFSVYTFSLSAQCLEYTYDTAGNRTGRSNVCTLLWENPTEERSSEQVLTETEKVSLELSPNPVENQMYIKVTGLDQGARVTILDSAGRQCMDIIQRADQVDVGRLIPGVYVVVVSDGRRKVAQMFVKK